MDKSTKTIEKVQKAEPKPTHRYFCDACTGIAFTIADWDQDIKTPKNCKVCGAPIGFVKEKNFIKI